MPFAGANREHHLDEGIAGAEPRNQSRVGAELRGESRGIVGDDFFAVESVIRNPLEDHPNKSEPTRRLLAV